MTDVAAWWRQLAQFPRSIRGLAFGFAAISTLVTVMLGYVTLGFVHEVLEAQLDDQIEVETRALAQYDREHGFEALSGVIQQRDRGGPGYLTGADETVSKTMGYILVDATGRRRAGAFRAALPPPGYTEFIHFARENGTYGIAQGLNVALPSGGRLLVAVDRTAIRDTDRALFRLFAGAFGALVVIGVVAMIGLGRVMRARLGAFERLATAVTGGEIGARMPIVGAGAEFDRLALLLNRMLDRISTLVVNLREVSTGLAHDLRTPLSRIRARIERAESAAETSDQRALLEEATRDMDALLALFGGLLAVSEIDGQSIRGRYVRVDLGDAIMDIAEAHRPAIEDSGRTLSVEAGGVEIRGDRALLQRAMGNLLDNAMLHTPPGSAVSVSLVRRGDHAIVRVADDGGGGAAEDHGRMFDRLVRLDPERSPPGHGLGLSMVAAIASAHDGSARAIAVETGLTIELEFPALPERTA